MTKEQLRRIKDADEALDADLQILEDRLRSERPDLFDETGAFREDEAQRLLEQRAAQKQASDTQDLTTVTRPRDRR